jgi:hypothetical protein
MRRRLEYTVVLGCLFLALVVGLAWLHADLVGYQRTWGDARTQTCGRFASARGRFVWQQCDLTHPTRGLNDQALEFVRRMRQTMPPDFVVGSNPTGDHVTLDCGSFKVPFAFPASGMVWGTTSRSTIHVGGPENTRWAASWSEYTAAYWLLMVLALLGPFVVAISWAWRRFKGKRPIPVGG